MSAPLELGASEEICVVIQYLCSKNKCAVEIYQEIVTTYGSYAIDAWNMRQWVSMFNSGQTSIFHNE